jgi:molybdate transport system regulatory protein
VRIHQKVWLEESGRVLFGEGRQQLLQAVEETGSLAGAARELNMSYRAAWGRLKASEERLGFALVERDQGGRRSMRLTQRARELMEAYRRLTEHAGENLEQDQAALTELLGRSEG